MEQLTTEGNRIVEDVAHRYDVSTDAVITLLTALRRGGGTQAQFSHPDLGGMGQWSRGGMVMVGDMFNHALKDRVDRLCTELSALVRDGSILDPAPTSQSQSQSQSSGGGGASLFVPAAEGSRWPAALGDPSSAGSQNDLHYAVFPGSRRLAIERAGRVTIYDTGDHHITGFSQQQSGDQSITFTSQHGHVRVADLPVVDGAEGDAQPRPAPTPARHSAEQDAPRMPSATEAPQRHNTTDDIFGKIERLAELRKKDILTADEFDTKKAELLGRL